MLNLREIEVRIHNIEQSLLQMASNGAIQTSTVDKSKSDIVTIQNDITNQNDIIEEMTLSQADMLLNICMLELGIEE